LTNVNGTIFGATIFGGTRGQGTVFSLTPAGVEAVIRSFFGSPGGSDPNGGLIDVNGSLYGTTYAGGVNGNGTIFHIEASKV
jgi:uncharacterized repeat protein (TIGR03803 family)